MEQVRAWAVFFLKHVREGTDYGHIWFTSKIYRVKDLQAKT